MILNTEQSIKNKTLSVERLEFGKFCVSPDGAVIRDNGTVIEYSLLGKSRGFPSDLVNYCKPNILDIEAENEDKASNIFPYGTILRPFVTKSNVQPIFFRVRRRFEKGENAESGRRYKLGRYLSTADHRINPFLFFEAMEQLPLGGITIQESRDIEPLLINEKSSEIDLLNNAAVKKAVTFILSGIGITVSEDMPEKDFFRFVFEVWSALPLALRPFISAGWGISPTLSNELIISCNSGQNSTRAYFSAASQEWRDPLQIAAPGTEAMNFVDFVPRMLKPGEAYLQQVVKELSDKPIYESGSSDKAITVSFSSKWMNELPKEEFSAFPVWQDISLRKIFRSPALKALDINTLENFKKWLIEGGQEQFLDVKNFFFYPNRNNAFEAILESLAETGEVKNRAESALWNSLPKNKHKDFTEILNDNPNENRKRAFLFAAVKSNNISEALKYLIDATNNSEAEDLPEYFTAELAKILNETIDGVDKESLSYHRQLLISKNTSQAYQKWLNVNGRRLLLTIASEFGGFEYDNIHINKIIKDPIVQTIHNVQTYLKPNADDISTIASLTDEEKKSFTDFIRSLWEKSKSPNNSLNQREMLLSWLNHLKPFKTDLPLWNLAFEQYIQPEHLSDLFAEVRNSLLPKSLENLLAVYVLRNYDLFSAEINHNFNNWQNVVSHFPIIYEKVLFPGKNRKVDSCREISKNISEAVKDFAVSADEANRLIDYWLTVSQEYSSEIRFVWKILIERGNYNSATSITNLCRILYNGHIPNVELPPLERMMQLVSFVHKSQADKDLRKNANVWWNTNLQLAKETKSPNINRAKEIILLLSLFPGIDFKPTAKQLELLVPYRQWLKRHLSEQEIHSNRYRRFLIASLDFHEVNYESAKDLWNEEFAGTVLWAVFSGAPQKLQSSRTLERTLELYSCTNGDRPGREISRQAELCHIYLEGYRRHGSDTQNKALAKVSIEGLVPLLRKGFGRRKKVKDLVQSAKNAWFGRDGLLGLGSKIIGLGLNKRETFRLTSEPLENLLWIILSDYGIDDLKRDVDDYFDGLKSNKR